MARRAGSLRLPSPRRRRGRPRLAGWRSNLLVGLQVPAADDFAAERTIRLLFLVLDFDLAVAHRDLFRRNDGGAGRASGLVRADQRIGESDDEEFLLVLAGLATGQDGRGQV